MVLDSYKNIIGGSKRAKIYRYELKYIRRFFFIFKYTSDIEERRIEMCLFNFKL